MKKDSEAWWKAESAPGNKRFVGFQDVSYMGQRIIADRTHSTNQLTKDPPWAHEMMSTGMLAYY